MFPFDRKRARTPPPTRHRFTRSARGARSRSSESRSSEARSSEARARSPVRPAASPLDLSWITETFALGGSFAPNQTAGLVEHRLSAVVDARGEGSDDAGLLARYGIDLLHLPTFDFEPISPRMLSRGIAFVAAHLDVGHRVLVHCARGIGRSALLGLCVLVERGHAPLDALTLAKDRRARISPSPAQLEAWVSWLTSWRSERGASWCVPTFDELTSIAYRHLP